MFESLKDCPPVSLFHRWQWKAPYITLDKFQWGYQTNTWRILRQTKRSRGDQTQSLSGQQEAGAVQRQGDASTNSPTPGSCAAVISSPNERKMPDALSSSRIHILFGGGEAEKKPIRTKVLHEETSTSLNLTLFTRRKTVINWRFNIR